jgi:hypothetical protein
VKKIPEYKIYSEKIADTLQDHEVNEKMNTPVKKKHTVHLIFASAQEI